MQIIRALFVGLSLVLCLAIGLWLGETYAPKPAVLVIPLHFSIDSDLADYAEEKLREAVENSAVAAIVLSIHTGGGEATAGERIYHAVLQARRSKPVVVSVNGAALSAGYLISVAADSIYAPAMSAVGSIGTRSPRPGDPQFPEDEIVSGPYKANEVRFESIRRLELDTDAFAVTVLHHRQSAANPLQISLAEMQEGRSYLGREALALGLIDAIGGEADAVAAAASLTGLRSYQTQDAEQPKDWFLRRLLASFGIQSEIIPTPATVEGE